MRLHLRSEGPRSWHRSGTTWACGTAHASDGRVLDAPALAAYLDVAPAAFAERIAGLGGTFAALQTGPTVRAATDRIRSTPLFYGRDRDGTLCLSDDARWLAETVGAHLDNAVAAAAFLLASTTTGASTLCSAVRQVQAAEIVTFHERPGEASGTRYFFYGDGDRLDGDETALVDEGVRLFEASFAQLLASVEGRPLAVPLSGGLDSRLIAAMLARGGRTDALCFSYGRERSFEAQASRRVAEALGIPWTFVPYSNAQWQQWFASPSFQRFRRRATGLTAIEHEQDWPAVQALKSRLDPGTVFVPGHTGDFLSSGHLSAHPAADDPVERVLAKHHALWPRHGLAPDLAAALRMSVAETLDTLPGALPGVTFEWQERQAKMIANSVRVYEHHGFDWRLPLWASPAVLNFWGRLPLPLLRTRSLYRRVLRALMGDALFDLPGTHHRTPSRVAGAWHRLTDRDLRRYGIWLGPRPLLAALRVRVGDLYAIDHPVVGPVVEQVIRPVKGAPPQRIDINGLLALAQLDTLSRELG